MEPGVTHEAQAKAIKEQLGRANAKIIGIVFNKVSEESGNSYYDYQYRSLYSPKYYGDYTSNGHHEPVTASRSKAFLDFLEHGRSPSEIMVDIKKAISTTRKHPSDSLNPNGKSKHEDK